MVIGKKKPHGYCVACGKYGRLSKEHFWPKWLRKRMGNPTFTFTYEVVGRAPKVKVGNLGMLNVRKPCRECNEGWMRDLQNQARPLLEAMMDARFFVMEQDAQRVVAAWGAMTAYMYAETNQKGSGVSRDHYDWLRLNGIPHPNTRVRTSCYQPLDRAGWFHAQHLAFTANPRRPSLSVPPPNGYWISLCIEHLVLQVLGYCGSEELSFQLDIDPPGIAYHLHPFSRRRRWPPLHGVQVGNLEKLATFPSGPIAANFRPKP
jgi:hypothetical protein